MDDALIITIDYETPPSVDEIGALFTALGQDYSDFTRGRVLAVASIQEGSITTTLKDWALVALPYVKDVVEVAKGAKALADFGKLLTQGIEAVKGGKKHKPPTRRGRKTKAERTIEATLSIAAVHGRAVRIKRTTAKGDMLEVEMNAPVAIGIREAETPEKTMFTAAEVQASRALTAEREVTVAIESLRRAGSQSLSPTQIESVVQIIVSVLKSSGAEYALPQIASSLEMHELYEFAAAVRRHIRGSTGTEEPPLLPTT